MKCSFGSYFLDTDRAELIGPDGPIHIERYPLNVLACLIENADRVVTRDDLIQAVWGGRIVSDAAVSTAVKQARRAVGDSGSAQAIIRTVHGRGFRFVAETSDARSSNAPATAGISVAAPTRETQHLVGTSRPSIAVLRFLSLGSDPRGENLAVAIPAELIAGISRVGWLHVIARASSFRIDQSEASPQDVGQRLGVRYMMTGVVEVVGETLAISVEIVSTVDGSLVWSDRFAASLSEIHLTRQNIVASVVAALDLAIPQYEASGSRRLNANEFDAWSRFHLGLSHIFKFNLGDNLIAAQHFRAALALDPAFGRAHAGLSFTQWQNAFMQYGDDRKMLVEEAIASANRALEIDPIDPFANFNMGRARWLEGDIAASQAWLDRALQINPNFAQCHYNKGLILVFEGNISIAQQATDKAMSLSPLDPLYYAMLSVRAMTHISNDEFEEAARLSARAAQLPGAHFYISLIAAAANELKGDRAAALRWRDHAIAARANVSREMFFSAFPLRENEVRRNLARAFEWLNLP